MKSRLFLHCIFIGLLLICYLRAFAQPTLPDLTAKLENGSVHLAWTSQYNSIKSITVKRSGDSVGKFYNIGMVTNVKKGVQSFTDNEPDTGRVFYQLSILFNSGLKWSSNHVGVYITGIPRKNGKSENDTQKQVVMVPKPAMLKKEKKNTIPIDTVHKLSKVLPPIPKKSSIPVHDSLVSNPKSTPKRDTLKPSKLPHDRLKFAFGDDPIQNPNLLVKSKYVSTDSLTGQILINVDDNVTKHRFVLTFYTSDNKVAVEIPRLPQQNLVLEKLNFQKIGMYKFILKKDGLELERGYVNVRW